MEKIKKKLSKTEKFNLKFVVEEFLEKDKKELSRFLKKSTDNGQKYYLKLDAILFKRDIQMPGDPDEEDIMNSDFEKLTLDLHKKLRPAWNKIKKNLMDFQEKVLPERKAHLVPKSKTKNSNDTSNYKGIHGEIFLKGDTEKYELKFRAPMMKYDMYFETGTIKFIPVPNQQIIDFFKFLEDIPISYFSRCAYKKCKKVIILTRSNKKFCTGTNCAARRFQAEKWSKDKEGMLKAERKRYHAKRKK